MDISAINNGSLDSYIMSYAEGLKTYGHPVFLKWFGEMNIHGRVNSACGAQANPAAFVTAWQRIWDIFHGKLAVNGQTIDVSNVAFVWCPSSQDKNPTEDAQNYYPGDQYVDWIGVDGYESTHLISSGDNFANIFGSFYTQWSTHGKPIMIGETGAPEDNVSYPNAQQDYIADIINDVPREFPDIKAIEYFDSSGSENWTLGGNGTSSTGTGLGAFITLAHTPYFDYATSN